MKRLLCAFFLITLMGQFSFATTYFKNWVNETESNTLTQGDFYAWEYDVSVPGGSALLKIIVDVNSNAVYDADDVVLIVFKQTDGEPGEGAPGDSGVVADGIIYTQLGPFGFAPGDYLFEVQDQNDQSTVVGTLHIAPRPNVTVWVKGTLSIEGVTPPDQRLANYMFEASEENDAFGILSGLTDENGDFIINLPDDAVGHNFKIGYMFESQISGYEPDSMSYHNVFIQAGENSGFHFTLFIPDAVVYGSVVDEAGQLIPVNGWGSIENLDTYAELDFSVVDGSYQTAVPFASGDSIDVTFQLHFWSEELLPDYMMPVMWNNPAYTFTVSKGDSLQKNIEVLSTDTVIYVYGAIDGNPLPYEFEAWASDDQTGQSFARFNGQFLTKVPVRSGRSYFVRLANTDYSELRPPAGYYLEGGNWREAWPGDTVRFNFLPTQGAISGAFHFDPGDPTDASLESSTVQAFTQTWDRWYEGVINWDSLKYRISVPGDTFNVRFRNWDWNWLAFPDLYEGIIVNNGEVQNIDFTLNYAHATIKVHLKNAHIQDLGQYHQQISTQGVYPNVYVTEATLKSDTSFYFKVCEGQWNIPAPYVGNGYVPEEPQAQVTVTEDSSYYYVEFVYRLDTGIEERKITPEEFYVKPNYPNPFNPRTTIEFGLPQNEHVTVTIYNLNGQKISNLFAGHLPAGIHRIQWNAQNFASGIYFFQVKTEKRNVIKRMLLIK
ncbi:T9SS type A sorting domain-containing protein [Caldithrix abyssi]